MLERKRLHISPFNPELLPIILPAPILEHVSNISFHALQTFPDRNYGYVDLPVVEADKVKKKFHGSILKGSKMRVEVARPEKARNPPEGDGLNSEHDASKVATKKGKRKPERADGVIPGFELPEGRKVQRGWTEPAGTSKASKTSKTQANTSKKKLKSKSKFTDGEECLFKTKLPPNASELGKSSAPEGKARKRKRGDVGREVVVHEFSNTTKHATFLKEIQSGTSKKSASEYIEGRGWVDEDGNTVESEPSKRRTRSASRKGKLPKASNESTEVESPDVGRTGGNSSMRSTSPIATLGRELDDETSSSGTSSSSENDEESTGLPKGSPVAENHNQEERDVESGIDDDVTSKTQAVSLSNTPAPEVHPLEALFKRPKAAASSTPRKPALELSTSFKFFGESPNEQPENPSFLMPQTPFTQQDFRARRQRSAAPTPDTAAPGKTFGDVWRNERGGAMNEEGANSEDDDDEPKASFESGPQKSDSPSPNHRTQKTQDEETTGGTAKESEFDKWFWEHRGDNNRAWKRRRRETAREKRKEDNKNRSTRTRE
jgi:hypothetical protein